MNAYDKLQLSLEKLWWGASHPTQYVVPKPNEPGEYCGVGRIYNNSPRDALHNLWLWQMKFKTPNEMLKISINTQMAAYHRAMAYQEVLHKGVELGVASLGMTPDQFRDYIEDFDGAAAFRNGGFKAKKLTIE